MLFGIMVLITSFETTTRARLWTPSSQNEYIPAVKFGAMTGMPRQRSNDLWSAMVDILNWHQEHAFIPSEWICVDKAISQWYGLGNQWINI